jgi:hypothetical protein
LKFEFEFSLELEENIQKAEGRRQKAEGRRQKGKINFHFFVVNSICGGLAPALSPTRE